MEFKWSDGKEKWTGTLEKMIEHKESQEVLISGRSTLIHGIIGESLLGKWICFPEREYACGLSSLEDVYWNEGKIAEGLGITAAITVTQYLKEISQKKLKKP